MFPLEQSHVWVCREMKGYANSREIIFQEFQPISPRYLNVTGRQTDRHRDEQTTWLATIPLYGTLHAVKLVTHIFAIVRQ